jgi:hypothetical protein
VQNKTFFILLFLIFWPGGRMKAQFSLSGEFRPRSEFRHGYQTLMTPGDDPAFFISQRSRIILSHSQEPFSMGLSLQDIRVWGEVPQLNRTGINTNLHEAWAELALSPRTRLKAGRQEIVYDDHRIFGNVDWAQQGRSHDAAILKFSTENDYTLHAGFAFNQQSERITGTVYNLNNYKTFQYLWLNKKWEALETSLLFLNNGWQNTSSNTTFSQTAGGRFVYSQGFTVAGSAYLQTGRDQLDRSLSAHYAGAEISLPLSGVLNLQAGFELLSGTDPMDLQEPGRQNRSFNPFYGTNHKFNGHMDYFYVGNHINNVGLRDLFGGMLYNRGQGSAGFRVHVFSSDVALVNPASPGESMPHYLGTEIDLYFGLQLYEPVALRFGYSHMLASRPMEVLKGGSRDEINNWAWLMLVFKPQFLLIQ